MPLVTTLLPAGQTFVRAGFDLLFVTFAVGALLAAGVLFRLIRSADDPADGEPAEPRDAPPGQPGRKGRR